MHTHIHKHTEWNSVVAEKIRPSKMWGQKEEKKKDRPHNRLVQL